MTFRCYLAVGASALTLALSAASLAHAAQPALQGGYTYRTAPPSPNPHDPFRTAVKVPRDAAPNKQAACDCPMMKAPATHEACMSMGKSSS